MDKNIILTLLHIEKSYSQANRNSLVLDDVCLEVTKGEIIAIVGRSGSGKSTLLNMMSGIDMPDKGEIHIQQQIINQLSEHERTCFRRKNLGFVFQFFNLIPTLTAIENISLPLELNNLLNTELKQQVLSLLDSVDLREKQDYYPDQLSGGEQQRIAILRAIVHKPSLIFADEPTGNLDAKSGERALDLLINMVKEYQSTLIMVTHSDEVAAIADRIFSMQNGKLMQVSLA